MDHQRPDHTPACASVGGAPAEIPLGPRRCVDRAPATRPWPRHVGTRTPTPLVQRRVHGQAHLGNFFTLDLHTVDSHLNSLVFSFSCFLIMPMLVFGQHVRCYFKRQSFMPVASKKDTSRARRLKFQQRNCQNFATDRNRSQRSLCPLQVLPRNPQEIVKL